MNTKTPFFSKKANGVFSFPAELNEGETVKTKSANKFGIDKGGLTSIYRRGDSLTNDIIREKKEIADISLEQ